MIAAIAFAVLFAAGLLTVPTLPGIDKAGYVFTIGSAVVLVEVFIATWFTAGLALHPHHPYPHDVGTDPFRRRHHGGGANPVGGQRWSIPAMAWHPRRGVRRRAA